MSQGETEGLFGRCDLVRLPGIYLVEDTGTKLVELPLWWDEKCGILQ